MLSFRQTFQYHPNIGHTFVPGLKMRVPHENGGYRVQVNQAGFRNDREFEAQRKPGLFRILVFGDSLTAGQPVSNKDRYSDQLEKLVPGVEVYNFGLDGSGTDQQYLVYQEFAPRYQHGLVVIGIYIENIRRILAHYRIYHKRVLNRMGVDVEGEGERTIFAKPYFTLGADGELIRHHLPVPRDPYNEKDLPPEEQQAVDHGGPLVLLRKGINQLGLRDVVQKLTHSQPFPAYDDPNSAGWTMMRAILKQWIKDSMVPVVICPVPVYRHVEETTDPSGYQARFGELAAETGAIVHDPLPDFWQLPIAERRSFRYKTDIHPGARFHHVLAQSLARAVQPLVEKRSAA